MAQNLVNLANDELKAKEKELSQIEREINPLLDEDNQVCFLISNDILIRKKEFSRRRLQ